MIWTVRIGNEDAATVKVSDALLHSLSPRIRDAEIRQLDPYRDVTLDRRALARWQAELARITGELRAETAGRLAQMRRLPSDANARDLLLNDWVERELASDRDFQELREIEAAVALALEGGGVIVAIGD
jgi:hypothetical protein